MNRTSRNIFAVLASLILSGAAISAQAHCKGQHTGNHEHCIGGGEQSFLITITPGVMSGTGVEGAAESVEVTEAPSVVDLTLVLNGDLSLGLGTGQDIATAFNDWCGLDNNGGNNGGNMEDVPPMITSADISVHANAEQEGDWTVVVGFSVAEENYTLLLLGQGEPGVERAIPGIGDPDVIAYLDRWNLRGGGKGRNRRCQPGTKLLFDTVVLTVSNTTQ